MDKRSKIQRLRTAFATINRSTWSGLAVDFSIGCTIIALPVMFWPNQISAMLSDVIHEIGMYPPASQTVARIQLISDYQLVMLFLGCGLSIIVFCVGVNRLTKQVFGQSPSLQTALELAIIALVGISVGALTFSALFGLLNSNYLEALALPLYAALIAITLGTVLNFPFRLIRAYGHTASAT